MPIRHLNIRKDQPPRATYHRLFNGDGAAVEELETSVQTSGRGVAGFASRRHIVLPIRGSFRWQVGSKDIFAEPTQALYVESNEEYRISHPFGGDASLVLWPDTALLDEIMHPTRAQGLRGNPFRQRSRLLSCRAQVLAIELRQASWQGACPMAIEELIVALLAELFPSEPQKQTAKTYPHSKINRAREYLHEHYRESVSLGDVAAAVDLSPVYLTQTFTEYFGISLYRYLVRMRMSEAITRIPQCADLTELALDLGFSSHSHFTSTFRTAFGCSPSALRSRFNRASCAQKMIDRQGTYPVELELCIARSNHDEGIVWTPSELE